MKKSLPLPKSIKLSQLLLNIENPRFEMGNNQRDVIQKMIEDQGDKLYHLAQHIVEHGLNPAELAIVTPSEREDKRFEVLEGNRRITALKTLTNPALIDNEYKKLGNKIKKLSTDFRKSQIKEVPCVVFNDPKDAYKWIKLKHTGQNNGVGTVEWDTMQQGRFQARVEGTPSNSAIQVIDFLNKSPHFESALKPDLKKVPLTNMGRLLGDPEFREFLGLSLEDGKLESPLNETEVVKGLTKVVKDLIRPEFTVKDIYYKDDRKKYIESFKKDQIPDKKKRTKAWGLSAPSTGKAAVSKKKKKPAPVSTARKTLIPRDFIVNISASRVNNIYLELKDIEVEKYENAVGVLFRVFVELSVDTFITKRKIQGVKKMTPLKDKLEKVIKYMEDSNTLNGHGLKGIKTAVNTTDNMLSIDTFNAYVHNPDYSPEHKSLKKTWEHIQPFMEKILEII